MIGLLLLMSAQVEAAASPLLPAPVIKQHAQCPFVVTIDAYPRDAVEAGVTGTTTIRYVVAANGVITRCAPVSRSGSESLDAATCGLVNRRLCKPAKDQTGANVPELWEWTVTWSNAKRRDISLDEPRPVTDGN
jgi:TonB family protein